MKLGDVLEWLAGAGFVLGAWAAVTHRWTLAVPAFVAAVFLLYRAQIDSKTPFPWPRREDGRRSDDQ